METERSCRDCIHFEMCKWVGEPNIGASSGGAPTEKYSEYCVEWYELQGRYCLRFIPTLVAKTSVSSCSSSIKGGTSNA